jgi:hypothetical protein
VTRAAWLLGSLVLLGNGTRAAAPAVAAQMRLTLLSPRNGTQLALGAPWFIELFVSGAARGAQLHFAFSNYAELQSSPLVEEGHHKFRMNVHTGSTAEREVLLDVYVTAPAQQHSVVLATASAWVSFRTPDLAIFHPMNSEPALIAPGRPLVVNFGLVACVMAVPGLRFRVQGFGFRLKP